MVFTTKHKQVFAPPPHPYFKIWFWDPGEPVFFLVLEHTHKSVDKPACRQWGIVETDRWWLKMKQFVVGLQCDGVIVTTASSIWISLGDGERMDAWNVVVNYSKDFSSFCCCFFFNVLSTALCFLLYLNVMLKLQWIKMPRQTESQFINSFVSRQVQLSFSSLLN